jgi:putative transposase
MGLNRTHKRNRLLGYDYSQEGWYFVTICTHNREDFFGGIKNGQMVPSEAGKIAERCWREIPSHFPGVELDEFVVMPNHIHLIVSVGARHAWPPQKQEKPPYQRIPVVIGSFKSAVSKLAHSADPLGHFQWQRSYHDHIIRNDDSLNRIRIYIQNNPAQWEKGNDRNHLESHFQIIGKTPK